MAKSKEKLVLIDVPLSKLVEDPNNPNHMTEEEKAALDQIISTAGFVDPILVQPIDAGHYKIVDGHHRADAAQRLGMPTVPAVVWRGTDEEARKLLAIGLNKIRGQLNLGEVARILGELDQMSWKMSDLASMTGFTSDEIDSLLKAAQPQTEEDVLEGAATSLDDSDADDESTRQHVLELTFNSANDLQRAKRALKRAANGSDLGEGLLAIIASQ